MCMHRWAQHADPGFQPASNEYSAFPITSSSRVPQAGIAGCSRSPRTSGTPSRWGSSTYNGRSSMCSRAQREPVFTQNLPDRLSPAYSRVTCGEMDILYRRLRLYWSPKARRPAPAPTADIESWMPIALLEYTPR